MLFPANLFAIPEKNDVQESSMICMCDPMSDFQDDIATKVQITPVA